MSRTNMLLWHVMLCISSVDQEGRNVFDVTKSGAESNTPKVSILMRAKFNHTRSNFNSDCRLN